MDRIWPFTPNWRDRVEETPSYKTDIITSRSGKEQRRALRVTPRKVISYTTQVAADDRRRFIRLLNQWQGLTIYLPDPTRRFVVGERTPDWLTVGRQLVVGDTIVTFTSISTLPSGTVIRPALRGQLSGEITATHMTSRVAEANVTFAVDPGTEQPVVGGPTVYQLGGREVLWWRWNWASGISEAFAWPTETVDYGQGRTTSYRVVEEGWFTQQADFLLDVPELERFFHRMKGRRGEFFMPTGTDDLTIVATAAAGSQSIRVAGTDAVDHPAIAIRMKDGRLILREVDGITGDTLHVTKPWLTDIDPAAVAQVSWAPLFRFAADDATFQWSTARVTQVQFTMRSLPAAPAERPLPPLDGAADWVLETWGLGYLLEDLDHAVNTAYPAVTFAPDAWVRVNEPLVDSFDRLVNIDYPEAVR